MKDRNFDLKSRVRVASSMNTELSKALTDLSSITRIPKSRLLDEAVELLLEKHNYNITKSEE